MNPATSPLTSKRRTLQGAQTSSRSKKRWQARTADHHGAPARLVGSSLTCSSNWTPSAFGHEARHGSSHGVRRGPSAVSSVSHTPPAFIEMAGWALANEVATAAASVVDVKFAAAHETFAKDADTAYTSTELALPGGE